MSNLIEVKVTNECGDELLLTNVFSSGAIIQDDMVVVNVYGKEANVSIDALQAALQAVRSATYNNRPIPVGANRSW